MVLSVFQEISTMVRFYFRELIVHQISCDRGLLQKKSADNIMSALLN